MTNYSHGSRVFNARLIVTNVVLVHVEQWD